MILQGCIEIYVTLFSFKGILAKENIAEFCTNLCDLKFLRIMFGSMQSVYQTFFLQKVNKKSPFSLDFVIRIRVRLPLGVSAKMSNTN